MLVYNHFQLKLWIFCLLDTVAFRTSNVYFTCNNKVAAETVNSNKAQQHYIQLNPQILSSSSEIPITASFNLDKHDSQAIILKRFFFNCGGIELQEESSDIKQPNTKEEIAQYVIRNTESFSKL